MLAWGAPPGLLPHMAKLRWAQALTAGVETWLALPDLPPGLTLTCARGTHRESMAENILGALFTSPSPTPPACWTGRTASASAASPRRSPVRRWAFSASAPPASRWRTSPPPLEPLDAAWVDAHRVMQGVTPVEPIDPAERASATCSSSPSAARRTPSLRSSGNESRLERCAPYVDRNGCTKRGFVTLAGPLEIITQTLLITRERVAISRGGQASKTDRCRLLRPQYLASGTASSASP